MGCWFSKPVAPAPFDYYRNPPLRYLGYAGHIGGACRSLLPPSVALVPQMVTTTYIIADVFNATMRSQEQGHEQKRVVINGLDALIWQSLASIIIPGIVFSGIRKTAQNFFTRQTKAGGCTSRPGCVSSGSLASRLLPCALALLAVPFIMGPIDRGVDYLMNNTYRKWTAPTEDEIIDPKELARRERKKAQEAKCLAEKAKKEEERRLKEAKEAARKKCQEEAKKLKEKLAAEDKALKEKLKREEAEFKEKQAKLAEEQRKKLSDQKLQCE